MAEKKKMLAQMTEAKCWDCGGELFVVTPDTAIVDGYPEHEACQGFNTEIWGTWYEEVNE